MDLITIPASDLHRLTVTGGRSFPVPLRWEITTDRDVARKRARYLKRSGYLVAMTISALHVPGPDYVEVCIISILREPDHA